LKKLKKAELLIIEKHPDEFELGLQQKFGFFYDKKSVEYRTYTGVIRRKDLQSGNDGSFGARNSTVGHKK
jgi:hypothetical protein